MRHLVIMAKAPRMGLVKTRLAAELGHLEAARLYRLWLTRLVRETGADARWQTHLAIAPRRFLFECGLPRPHGLHLTAQTEGDLGARMGDLLRRLPPGDVVFVGSDIPALERRHVAQAFAALSGHEAVFGPAEDGGYWLIGLRRRPLLLPFANVRWSTRHALEDTLANLEGRRIGFLERLADIDDAEDWRRFKSARCARAGAA